MKTVSVDKYQRIRLPDVKGGQKFAYENQGNGVLVLTEVKPVQPRPVKGRLERRGERLIGITNRQIDMDALREALADFP